MTLESEIEKIIDKLQGFSSGQNPYIIHEEVKELANAIASYLRKEGWVKKEVITADE